jgi:uncharacterized damage-inducible protein DinB
LLVDAFDRIQQGVEQVVANLTPEQLAFRINGTANSIAWIVWHLTRIQDDHVADVSSKAQVWTSQGWAERFGLPFTDAQTGYGHNDEQVAAVQVDTFELLAGYHDAVYHQTVSFVRGLTDQDLARVVDPSWDPPVTLGVRLISVISDDLQHLGQAEFVRGVL